MTEQLALAFDAPPRYDLCEDAVEERPCPLERGQCCREQAWLAAGRPLPVPYGVIPFQPEAF